MKLNHLCAALFIGGSASAADAPPPKPRLVDHNGSLMQIMLLPNDGIDIVYQQVRPALWGYAVPGQIAVHGRWRQGVLYATAYVTGRCGPVPYPVSGGEEHGVLVLRGPAPLLDPWSCQVLQWIWSANSVLAFTPVR